MPRNLTVDMVTELGQQVIRPILLFKGEFLTNTIRLWTGIGDLTWDSSTWLGNGWLQFPQGGEESIELNPSGLTINLMGVPQAILSIVLNQGNSNSNGTLYLGLLDSSGAVIADPYKIFVGKLDTTTIAENSDSTEVMIAYESKFIDFERSKEFRYTQESQKIFYPSDKGFEYVPALQDWTGYWGGEKQKPKKKDKKSKRQRATR